MSDPRPSVLVVAEQLRRAVPGGIGTYARALLGALGRLDGADRPPVTVHASRPTAHPDPLSGFGLPVHASRWPGPMLTRAWDHGLVQAPAGFDVVHAVSLATPAPASDAALVVVVHDLLWRTRPDDSTRRGRRWHEAAWRRAVRRADRLVAPSVATATALRAAGADERQVVVLGWGADHLPVADSAATDRLLDRLGVHGPFLLSVSTLEPRKNLDGLVAAYRRARPQLPGPWPLVLVGPAGWGPGNATGGPAGRPADGPGDGVVFAGHVDAAVLAGLLGRAALLAYVPHAEGFGLPPLEAMAAGTAVVASPMPSLEGAAYEVDPADPAAIADGLAAVAGDDTLRARLVDAGRRRTAGCRWDDVARRHVELWGSLR